MGQHFHKIEAVRLEGGDPPPSGQPDHFFPVFFLRLPEVEMLPMRDGTNEQQAKIELLSF